MWLHFAWASDDRRIGRRRIVRRCCCCCVVVVVVVVENPCVSTGTLTLIVNYRILADYISKSNKKNNTNQSGLTNHNSHRLLSQPQTKETVCLSQ